MLVCTCSLFGVDAQSTFRLPRGVGGGVALCLPDGGVPTSTSDDACAAASPKLSSQRDVSYAAPYLPGVRLGKLPPDVLTVIESLDIASSSGRCRRKRCAGESSGNKPPCGRALCCGRGARLFHPVTLQSLPGVPRVWATRILDSLPP